MLKGLRSAQFSPREARVWLQHSRVGLQPLLLSKMILFFIYEEEWPGKTYDLAIDPLDVILTPERMQLILWSILRFWRLRHLQRMRRRPLRAPAKHSDFSQSIPAALLLSPFERLRGLGSAPPSV